MICTKVTTQVSVKLLKFAICHRKSIKACPHYETGLMRVEGKLDLSRLNSVSTRPHLIRVDASSLNLNSLGYLKTAKENDNTSACCQIIGILSATAIENVLDARAQSAPFLTQFQPTSNPHTYVGWLNPGSTRFRKKWVECGLAISEFNPG